MSVVLVAFRSVDSLICSEYPALNKLKTGHLQNPWHAYMRVPCFGLGPQEAFLG